MGAIWSNSIGEPQENRDPQGNIARIPLELPMEAGASDWGTVVIGEQW